LGLATDFGVVTDLAADATLAAFTLLVVEAFLAFAASKFMIQLATEGTVTERLPVFALDATEAAEEELAGLEQAEKDTARNVVTKSIGSDRAIDFVFVYTILPFLTVLGRSRCQRQR
jgi:hypothetical protein